MMGADRAKSYISSAKPLLFPGKKWYTNCSLDKPEPKGTDSILPATLTTAEPRLARLLASDDECDRKLQHEHLTGLSECPRLAEAVYEAKDDGCG
jgi:hypothetical protein